MTSASVKVEMKEIKAESEACKKEEKEGTPPPMTLPMEVGQLEKALPTTHLLEKKRLMHLVHNELELKKIDVVRKEEVLQKREDELRDKDLAMQESLINSSKLIQENAIKKKRAEKKSQDEIQMRLEKEAEITVLEDALQKLKEHRTIVYAQLEQIMIYHKYLEVVLEKATQFHEIHDLMQRHATLDASHKELKLHIAKSKGEIEVIRQELQQYLKNSANTILTLNNDISIQRQEYEQKRLATIELQLNIDSTLEQTATRTLARSQVCIAADNLFYRIDKASIIARPVQDNPLKNLDMVADFITDLAFIQKAYRLDLAKKAAAATPKGG